LQDLQDTQLDLIDSRELRGLCAKPPCLLLPLDRTRTGGHGGLAVGGATIGVATGSTKVGKREWRSGRIHRSAHLGRRRAARWPAANLNGGRRRFHAAMVLRCISGDGKQRNGFISAKRCLRRPRFPPVVLHAGESSMVGGELDFRWRRRHWMRRGR
jgi:hypothetical protein